MGAFRACLSDCWQRGARPSSTLAEADPALPLRLVLDRVDLVLDPVLGLFDLVLHGAGGLVLLALTPQLVVVGQASGGFLGASLEVIDLAVHARHSFVVSAYECLTWSRCTQAPRLRNQRFSTNAQGYSIEPTNSQVG